MVYKVIESICTERERGGELYVEEAEYGVGVVWLDVAGGRRRPVVGAPQKITPVLNYKCIIT